MGVSFEAEGNIARALSSETTEDATALVFAAVATAQATLLLAEETRALVEAQRLANDIEALRLGASALEDGDPAAAKTGTSRDRIVRLNTLRGRIREGLGLK